ncbi:MAG TPA: hypothetical protein VJY62_22450 [Bacteroidia bacterium]|nr:hypothetical protein [Bacteroidia bacterium]
MIRFNKHISVLLLLISSLFIVPKELLHELSFHDDTNDHCCTNSIGDFAIGTVHHHCDILEVFVPPYHASGETILFSQATEIISHYSFNAPSFSFEIVDSFEIRGPPAGISFC